MSTMRTMLCTVLLVTLTYAGSSAQRTALGASQPLTAARATGVEDGVRAFMHDVAHAVTQDGPAAWRKYFADTPAFFMAVDGKIAFANSAEVTTGLPQVALAIKQIELKWGDDLRVDLLAPDLAVVGASYHELQAWADGRHIEDKGYFTGVAQYRDGRWQFRNAHWSEPVPPPVP
ncbi:MAG: hypothetical protein ABSB66_09390 [Candidatus Acidiferrales bacterium]